MAPGDAEALSEAALASETGFVAAGTEAGVTLVLPPFAVEGALARYDEVHLAPLIAALEKPRSYAVILLRLGGFSLGFFRGRALIDSKTDQRFVKGRHRKGGQSSTRFARIREKQIHELFGKACAAARDKLTPYEAEIEHLFFGGDRRTLQGFRKECAYLERFAGRIAARILPAPGDPRLQMLRAMPDEVCSSEVYQVTLAS